MIKIGRRKNASVDASVVFLKSPLLKQQKKILDHLFWNTKFSAAFNGQTGAKHGENPNEEYACFPPRTLMSQLHHIAIRISISPPTSKEYAVMVLATSPTPTDTNSTTAFTPVLQGFKSVGRSYRNLCA